MILMMDEGRVRNMKRIITLCLSVVMTFVLTACGKKQEVENLAEQEEFLYVPEYIVYSDEDGNSNYNNLKLVGNFLYYIEYQWDLETNDFTNTVNCYSLQDHSVKQIPIKLEENQYLMNMAVDSEKNLYLLYSNEPEESSAKTFLKKCDEAGNILLEKEITEMFSKDGEQLWVQNMTVDGQGNLYFIVDRGICLMDAFGTDAGMLTIDNGWIQDIVTDKNGNVYMVCSDYHSIRGETVLAKVDFTGKKIGTVYKNFPGSSLKSITAGEDNTFFINDGIMIYQYDLTTQKYKNILIWQDSNINGNDVDDIIADKDGAIYATINAQGMGKHGIIKLNEVKPSELPPKEEIIFSTLEPNEGIEAAAAAFNNQSDKYHVTIKTYLDIYHWNEDSYKEALVRFYDDISSTEECSDILDVSLLAEHHLVEKDIFEDLYPYLEQSDTLAKEDFIESILKAVEYEGRLYFIPKSFALNSIVGKSSIVGEQMGWTLEEMKECAKEHSDAFLFDALRKEEALYYCMAFNQDYFVDWEKGACYFDTDEFKSLLEFVNTFPDEIDWSTQSSDEGEWIEKLRNDKILLRQIYISGLGDMQFIEAQYGEAVTYIGFPCMKEGVGCMLNAGGRYGINTKSRHKEGAWAFLEYYLTMDIEHDIYFCSFSTLQEKFQKQMEEAISEDNRNVMGTEGWEYTYHVPDEEDVEQLKELIAVARPAATTDNELIKIIQEEAEPYFQGQKTVEEVTVVIQGRLQIYVSENS